MMTVVAIVFWMWFAVSLVIVVRRNIRRRAEKRARRDGLHAALKETGTAADPGPADDVDPLAPETNWTADAAPTAPAPAPTPPAPTRAAAPPEPVAEPVAETVAPVAPAAAAIPQPSSVATIARTAAAPVTVAQVIAGIEMPCGLVPLTLSDHDLRYDRGQRAQFFTTDIPAAIVGSKLADELERIGLTVSSIGDAVAVAQRGRLAVEMRIVAVGAAVDGVASTEYRSAPPNSVVVEFNVVTGA
jgi:hypothetical protein